MISGAALARRLDAAEARNDAACAEAQQRIDTQGGAALMEVAGGFAIYAGAESPLTHAVGLGMQGVVKAAEIDRMEAFFGERGVAPTVDVCPLADGSLIGLLRQRGYGVAEFNTVLARSVAGGEFAEADGSIRAQTDSEETLWSQTVARGFLGKDELTRQELDVGRAIWHMAGVRCYLGRQEGKAVGAAALAMRDGVALLFADSTLMGHRGMGVQGVLIRRRLQDAAAAGCEIASASTMPGSVSQRNYERRGFQVAYTKAVLVGPRRFAG